MDVFATRGSQRVDACHADVGVGLDRLGCDAFE